MRWIPIEDEAKPQLRQIAQLRINDSYREAYTTLGFRAHGMTFGDGPLRVIWRSVTLIDSKGRNEEILNVTHWAPLLGPELE